MNEKIIDDVLQYKTSFENGWREYSKEELSARVVSLEETVEMLLKDVPVQ